MWAELQEKVRQIRLIYWCFLSRDSAISIFRAIIILRVDSGADRPGLREGVSAERAFLDEMYSTYARTLLVYSYPEVAVCLGDAVIGLAPGTAMCSLVHRAWS